MNNYISETPTRSLFRQEGRQAGRQAPGRQGLGRGRRWPGRPAAQVPNKTQTHSARAQQKAGASLRSRCPGFGNNRAFVDIARQQMPTVVEFT